MGRDSDQQQQCFVFMLKVLCCGVVCCAGLSVPRHVSLRASAHALTTACSPVSRTQTQVGGNFPLYGCCWYVREMLHRAPYLARTRFRSCRAPFRQCMIAAPRCYCLLSHYPFFELHFRVRGVSGVPGTCCSALPPDSAVATRLCQPPPLLTLLSSHCCPATPRGMRAVLC
jgi:hypothetical protein